MFPFLHGAFGEQVMPPEQRGRATRAPASGFMFKPQNVFVHFVPT